MSELLVSLVEDSLGQAEEYANIRDVHAELKSVWAQEIVLHMAFEAIVEAAPRSEWTFGMTPTFRRSVEAIDRKMQGRVLLAISELSEKPMEPRGDTVKALVGPKKGIWRYRIGEYRLIYEPDEKRRRITFHELAPRGSAYES